MFTSFAANSFLVSVVTKDHFEPGAYSNITEAIPYWDAFGVPSSELFSSVLEGYNESTNSYEDLTPSECTKLYNTDYMSNHRNLFLITKHSSSTTHNNTLLDMISVRSAGISPDSWMCAYYLVDNTRSFQDFEFSCNPSELTSNVARGLPWRVRLTTGEEVEIGGCKSERTPEKCKAQFSLRIMLVIIFCNLVKACCMVVAVVRSREPTLVTLGDAIESFLTIPDRTTMGICFADRHFIKTKWSRDGWRAGPRRWKQKGLQRWWTSASKTRWITCIVFSSIMILTAGVSLRLGMDRDGIYQSTSLKAM